MLASTKPAYRPWPRVWLRVSNRRTVLTCSQKPAPQLSCSLQHTAKLYYEQVWSQGDIRLLGSLMAEEHEQLDLVWQPVRTSPSTSDSGLRRMKKGILAYRAAYPDLKFTVLSCSPPCPTPGAEQGQNSVFVHWTASGTNTGPIRGAAPSGRKASFSGISRLDFDADGLILRSHVYRQASADEAAYFSSAGILPWQTKPQDAQKPGRTCIDPVHSMEHTTPNRVRGLPPRPPSTAGTPNAASGSPRVQHSAARHSTAPHAHDTATTTPTKAITNTGAGHVVSSLPRCESFSSASDEDDDDQDLEEARRAFVQLLSDQSPQSNEVPRSCSSPGSTKAATYHCVPPTSQHPAPQTPETPSGSTADRARDGTDHSPSTSRGTTQTGTPPPIPRPMLSRQSSFQCNNRVYVLGGSRRSSTSGAGGVALLPSLEQQLESGAAAVGDKSGYVALSVRQLSGNMAAAAGQLPSYARHTVSSATAVGVLSQDPEPVKAVGSRRASLSGEASGGTGRVAASPAAGLPLSRRTSEAGGPVISARRRLSECGS